VITAIFVVLAAAGLLFAYRIARGPSLADRVLALDGLLTAGVAAIVTDAVRTGRGSFLPVAVVVTLVGFVSTAVVARFIERRGA
jgi:multisubunit Na+/H+ antiporter MnhF subunit